jgi:hypothetical protein
VESPDQVKETVAEINQRGQSGPPEGVPAVGLLLLHNDEGKVLAISLFDNEADYEQGDATLNSMNPPAGSMGGRAGVEKFDVGAKFDS